MREILFRGKRIDNGEWVVGIPWIFAPPVNKAVIVYAMGLVGEDDDTSRYCECHEVDPSTIGQYTGLTANGKKIFENGYMIIDNKTYKVIFDNAEYILTNIFNCDIITLKNNSIKGVFVDEI